jgi:hypothetical protein
MNEEQKQQLERLVEANEETGGSRAVIDYAISLAVACSVEKYGLDDEMTNFVEELYKENYNK